MKFGNLFLGRLQIGLHVVDVLPSPVRNQARRRFFLTLRTFLQTSGAMGEARYRYRCEHRISPKRSTDPNCKCILAPGRQAGALKRSVSARVVIPLIDEIRQSQLQAKPQRDVSVPNLNLCPQFNQFSFFLIRRSDNLSFVCLRD